MDMSASMNAARRVAAHNEVTRQQEAAQIGARMGGGLWPETRVTDEASWLDYERERLLMDADRRRAGPSINPGSDYDDDPRPAAMVVLYVLASAAITVIVLAIMGWVWVNTGPNCPGADPAWIGWCSEAPQVAQ